MIHNQSNLISVYKKKSPKGDENYHRSLINEYNI